MSQASHYLDVLTHEIGPRPAASDSERQAAEWLQDQFAQAELSAEMQDFDTPRFPQSARMFTYVLVPIAVFGIGAGFLAQMWIVHWMCWAILAALSVLTLLDLFGSKGPSGLISFLPKGPSQNVIAKIVPSSYSPGERSKKIILLANYDSALTSPLMTEAIAGLYRPLRSFANLAVMLMPVLSLLLLIDIAFLGSAVTWVYYFLLVLCVPGAVLLLNYVIARLMKRYSPGANNNASGIAAMLGVMDRLLEGQQGHSSNTTMTSAVRFKQKEKPAVPQVVVADTGLGEEEDFITNPPEPDLSAGDWGAPVSESDAAKEEPLVPVAISEFDNLDTGKDLGPVPLTPRSEAPSTAFESTATTLPQPSPRTENMVNFDTVEFGSLSDAEKTPEMSSYVALDDYDGQATFADSSALATDVLDADVIGNPSDLDVSTAPKEKRKRERAPKDQSRKKERKSRPRNSELTKEGRAKSPFFSLVKKRGKHEKSHTDDPSNWLGVDQDFDPRAEGKAIGNWDNFDEEAQADIETDAELDREVEASDVVDLTDSFAPLGGTGADTESADFGVTAEDFDWKSGFAGDDPIEDDSYASAEAARIRRKVLDSLDVDLKEKEVWLVATGAHFTTCAGARAFIDSYGDQLRDALFINLSALGSGNLHWPTKESFGKGYLSSARLTSMLRRLSRESNVRISPWKKKSLATDAGPILAAGRKAVTLIRLTDKGMPFAYGSTQDTAARLDSNNIDEAVDLVCNIIREA